AAHVDGVVRDVDGHRVAVTPVSRRSRWSWEHVAQIHAPHDLQVGRELFEHRRGHAASAHVALDHVVAVRELAGVMTERARAAAGHVVTFPDHVPGQVHLARRLPAALTIAYRTEQHAAVS